MDTMLAEAKRAVRRMRQRDGQATIANPQPVSRTHLQQAMLHRALQRYGARPGVNHLAYRRSVRDGLIEHRQATVRPVP